MGYCMMRSLGKERAGISIGLGATGHWKTQKKKHLRVRTEIRGTLINRKRVPDKRTGWGLSVTEEAVANAREKNPL